MKVIEDTFKDLPLSRQRKYQLRKKLKGFCQKCGRGAAGMTLCQQCFEASHYQRGQQIFASTSKRIKRRESKKAPKVPKRNPWLLEKV